METIPRLEGGRVLTSEIDCGSTRQRAWVKKAGDKKRKSPRLLEEKAAVEDTKRANLTRSTCHINAIENGREGRK